MAVRFDNSAVQGVDFLVVASLQLSHNGPTDGPCGPSGVLPSRGPSGCMEVYHAMARARCFDSSVALLCSPAGLSCRFVVQAQEILSLERSLPHASPRDCTGRAGERLPADGGKL